MTLVQTINGQITPKSVRASGNGIVSAHNMMYRHSITFYDAKTYARQCALNALAAVKSVIGDLDRITRIGKVVAFVASTPEFTGQPGVVNGASEFLGEVFGDAGAHARSAVGVPVLPLDSPVEIELSVEFE
jgi:enamine deaminase RidA (YjgF/YER057c/UK114 family)